MTTEKRKPPTNLSQAIQTHHPEIAVELQNAIDTLRKLQRITGSLAPDRGDVREADASTAGSLGATAAPLGASHAPSGFLETQDSAPRPRAPAMRLLADRESFGRYQIVRMLGRGAMGAVYLAYDAQLERYVALKTPFFGDRPDTVHRFYREARAAAKLRSPYICTIYDVGQVGDVHYISMEFIEGPSLGQCICEKRFSDLAQIGRIVAKIARGVHKAHEQGIIHRDLKPDNIMLDADGEPIVMDFGLAREAHEPGSVTSPGALIGTPAYMAPEQVEGDPSRIGPAVDLYSLGVILFEMLTGRLPFQGSLMSVLQQIGRADPPRPSSLVPELPADSPLERICLKLMAKSPGDRYGGMIEVAEAIERSGQSQIVSPTRATRRREFLSGLLRLADFFARKRRPNPGAPISDSGRALARPGAQS